MNFEHAQMLIDCLRNDADNFDMRMFFGPLNGEVILVERCGTARCIGGHAIACMAKLGLNHIYYAHPVATAEFLDITKDEAQKLCIPWITVGVDGEPLKEANFSFIWDHVEYQTPMSFITVDQAIQAINNLIDHYHELAQQS